jgi:hypothetical protein
MKGLAAMWTMAAVCWLAAGCAAVPYDPRPHIIDVHDQARVARDIQTCSDATSTYKRPLSVAGVATQSGKGGATNLPSAATGAWWVGPTLGVIGGGLTEILTWAGWLDTDRPKADQSCLFQEFAIDHAAVLAEPPL